MISAGSLKAELEKAREENARLRAMLDEANSIIKNYTDASAAKFEFERDNPNDTTGRWEEHVYRVDDAEKTLCAYATKLKEQTDANHG